MNDIYYFKDDIFSKLDESSKINSIANKVLFTRIGGLYFGNITSSAKLLANHFSKGIEEYTKFNLNTSFKTYNQKSISLIDTINALIQMQKMESTAILISGGKDSALLGKLLSSNGVEVIAYHATRYSKDHPETKIKLKSLNQICRKAGIAELHIVYGGAGPKNLINTFNNVLFAAPAAAACANIFLNTNISTHKYISFAQGADTLSNTVHNQHRYYNDQKSASESDIKSVLRMMYVTTYPKFYKLIGLKIINEIIYELARNLELLKDSELQNISRLVGMHLVHTPQDSKFVYNLAVKHDLKVFNPFHTLAVEELYMRNVKDLESGSFFSKNEIDIALRKFGMDSLNFDKSGFNAMRISDTGKHVSNKVFLSDLYSEALEIHRNSML